MSTFVPTEAVTYNFDTVTEVPLAMLETVGDSLDMPLGLCQGTYNLMVVDDLC